MNQQVLAVIDLFQYQGNKFRHLIDERGDPWIVAADVCSILDIANVSDAVEKLDEDERNTIAINEGIRGNPNRLFVNEPGLYRLIFQSRKPEAKAFTRWVTHEVLPSIRQTGSYFFQGNSDLFLLIRTSDDVEFNRKISRIRRLRRLDYPKKRYEKIVESHTLPDLLLAYIRRENRPVSARDICQYGPLVIRRLQTSGIHTLLVELVQAGKLVCRNTSKQVLYEIVL